MRQYMTSSHFAALFLGMVAWKFAAAPAEPQPAPKPMPVPTRPDDSVPHVLPGVVQCKRLEVLDDAGNLSAAIYYDGKAPVAEVNDAGKSRKLDLARAARLIK